MSFLKYPQGESKLHKAQGIIAKVSLLYLECGCHIIKCPTQRDKTALSEGSIGQQESKALVISNLYPNLIRFIMTAGSLMLQETKH